MRDKKHGFLAKVLTNTLSEYVITHLLIDSTVYYSIFKAKFKVAY
jgi:hypothetical protein